MLFGGALQRMIDTNVQLRDFENALGSCKTFDEWLEQLYRQCRTIGVAAVELNFNGEIFERMFAPTSHHCWSVIVPIGDEASLHLSVPPGATQTATAIMPMADLISRKLPEKFRSVRYAPVARALAAAGVDQRVSAEAI
jgi:hypothetical protein